MILLIKYHQQDPDMGGSVQCSHTPRELWFMCSIICLFLIACQRKQGPLSCNHTHTHTHTHTTTRTRTHTHNTDQYIYNTKGHSNYTVEVTQTHSQNHLAKAIVMAAEEKK